MLNNRVKQAIEDGSHPLGTWLSIGHPTVAEIAASLDIEFVLVDMEHTSMGLETVENMARAVDAAGNGTDMVVRVPWNDPVQLKRVVDIGVAGVMVPMVSTPAEATSLVEAVRYPPEGMRGIAGSRATGFGRNFEEYVTNANGSILTIAQIETQEGLENAEEIAAVDGIDALFVGPADLAGSLDLFPEWDTDSFKDALGHVVAAGNAVETPVGTLTTDVDDVAPRVEQGFDFLIAGKDAGLLMDGIERAADEYRTALDGAVSVAED